MYSYLMSKIEPDFVEVPEDKEFYWTESKNALIELLYALHAARSISGGRVGIRKITGILQVLFRIDLGDIHHAFHRMKVRSGTRTVFLDRLKMSLEEYMDKDLL